MTAPGSDADNEISHDQWTTGISHTSSLANLGEGADFTIENEVAVNWMSITALLIRDDPCAEYLQLIGKRQVVICVLELAIGLY